ncbi:MAG TPA: polyprenol monophosphomannose synthase [candidate division Zixibacteria bacterium]|nr:polyprenol monophosphomannose synthase [candidate division Zixibacteria bacterium]
MSGRVLVFLPTYNESENIEPIIRSLLALGDEYSVLVVDDLSPDGTGDTADRLAAETGRVEVIHRDGCRGRGFAGACGLRRAAERTDADYVIEMDADLSHPPDDAPRLVAEAKKGYDLVYGSRYAPGGGVQGWSIFRHINSRVANALARLLLNLPMRDCTSGFRCFSRELLAELNWDEFISPGPSIVEEVLFACCEAGARMTEIPYIFVDRKRGRSKVSLRIILRWLGAIVRIRLRGADSLVVGKGEIGGADGRNPSGKEAQRSREIG